MAALAVARAEEPRLDGGGDVRIMVGTDGSERALVALAQAAAFARAVDAELLVVRVLNPVADCADVPAQSLSEATEKLRAEWTSELQELVRNFDAPSAAVAVDVKGRHESTAETIVRLVEELGVQLVVVGTRGTGIARRVLIGSVATQVLQRSSCPVMLVGEQVGHPNHELPYHVLVSTDSCSPTDSVLTAFVRAMAGAAAERLAVTAVHVFDPATAPDETDSVAVAERLAGFTAQLPERFHPRSELILDEERQGPAEALLAFAKESRAHSILMATEGDSFSRQLFLGSVALSTVEHAHIPVILVRAEE
jgi:nucleotide-binding universal stress UspA family protein